MRPFAWSKQVETAAQLVAEGRLSDAAIAREVGVCRSTLSTWKLRVEFRDRLETILAEFRESLRRERVARGWPRKRRETSP